MKIYWLALLFSTVALAQSTFTVGMPGFPKALLHYAGNDELSDAVDYYVFEPLVTLSLHDRHPVPVLAESWRVSPDHRRYTFTLRKDARFADGETVTADDVKFTWDAIQDPKNRFIPARELFSSFSACETHSAREVTFIAKSPHFKNFEKLTSLLILPRHAGTDLTTPYPAKLVGSGPYAIGEVKLGDSVTLTRNPRYWGADGGHFERLVFKGLPDPQTQLELFRQGAIDLSYFLVAKLWATETDGPLFTSGKVKKLVVKTRLPFGTSGIAWNLRRPLFADRRVRRALAMLLDRPRLLHELFYDAYQESTGVVKSDSRFHDPRNHPLPFDPPAARRLLVAAGWRTGADGVLVQNGQRFSFEILAKEAAAERFLTRYQETLRQQGIEMRIRIADWATTLRRADSRDFDGVLIYRGRDVEPSDFALSWGSATAGVAGSENVTGFAEAAVDEWAATLDQTFDEKKREALTRRIDFAIADAAPLAFTWEPRALRFAYWSRFTFDGDGYEPYAQWYQVFRDWREDGSVKARR